MKNIRVKEMMGKLIRHIEHLNSCKGTSFGGFLSGYGEPDLLDCAREVMYSIPNDEPISSKKLVTSEEFGREEAFRQYALATAGMSDVGVHKVANYMKHGYSIGAIGTVVFLERPDRESRGECLIIDKDGKLFVGCREATKENS